ncbi:MAG TPA: cytochrome P450 [Dehalococcoidia bacterium]|nr:cytochrome P450 [Dehalococcoidia bacterium]
MVAGTNPLMSPENLDNPYPLYALARQFEPFSFQPEMQAWNAFLYEDCRAILRDPRRFSSDFQRNLPPAERATTSILNLDPPRHTQLRELVNRAFTPRMVQQLAPRIRAITDELLAAVEPSGRTDLIHDLAYPLPVIVIAEILGVPPEDRADFKRWSDVIAASLGTGLGAEGEDEAMGAREVPEQTITEMSAYFGAVVDAREREPRQDLISALIAAEIEGQKLTRDEILTFCILLLVAGNETTTNLIGNAVRTLLEQPAALARLRAGATLWPSAVEEVLRYRPPVQATVRLTTEDTELRRQAMKAGQVVIVWLASANRDADEFPNPDTFDIARSPNRHLSFGQGIHFCLGAPLARLEAAIALDEIGRRLPNLRRADAAPLEQVPGFIMHGVKHLPLAFDRRNGRD